MLKALVRPKSGASFLRLLSRGYAAEPAAAASVDTGYVSQVRS